MGVYFSELPPGKWFLMMGGIGHYYPNSANNTLKIRTFGGKINYWKSVAKFLNNIIRE